MKIIACHSNIPLSQKIAAALQQECVIPSVQRFQDKEMMLRIPENMHGEHVFVIQSTSQPANDHLMELLITIDALKRSIAKRITAVIPYYGYARQDRKTAPGTPISAKLVADLIATAGAHHVICLDWHAEQMQGFFNIPAYDLQVAPIFVKDIQQNYEPGNFILVSPDIGGVSRVRKLADLLNTDIAIVEKRRDASGNPRMMNIIGDVQHKNCIILDDIVDSGKTLSHAAQILHEAGARSVDTYTTHGVLSDHAIERITQSKIRHLVITDSIHPTPETINCPKIRILSVAKILAQAIRAIA